MGERVFGGGRDCSIMVALVVEIAVYIMLIATLKVTKRAVLDLLPEPLRHRHGDLRSTPVV